jgi:tRNA A37 threonylcarbamoyladenosine synthetase subunit TsaC/SUA5/YrdC
MATVLAVALVAAMLTLIPATAASATPTASQATETYVAIHYPAEIETIDSTTGAEVGSPTSLVDLPEGMAEFTPTGAADSDLIVAEYGDFLGRWIQSLARPKPSALPTSRRP